MGKFQWTFLYFGVHAHEPAPGRKTRRYELVNHSSGETIGEFRWYGGWRQYCFFPGEGTVWSAGCLSCVEIALKAANALHRRDLALRRQESIRNHEDLRIQERPTSG